MFFMDTETLTNSIETAQAPEAFDVLAFVQATAYPTEKVVVFQNPKAAAEYVKVVAERADLEARQKEQKKKIDTAELDAKVEELGDAIRKSSIVFELRGMPPGIVTDILTPPGSQGEPTEEETQARDNELVSKTIVRVTNHAGVPDGRTWTAEDVKTLRRFLKEGEFGKLLVGVSDVNFKAAIFDEATDAGFSSGSADVA